MKASRNKKSVNATTLPADDVGRFELIRSLLYTPVLGDILDQMGHLHQFLPQAIQPIAANMKLVGRAMPVLFMEVHGKQKRPFGRLTESIDALKPGDVYVARNPSAPCAVWGELLTAAARMRGATGAVIDGFHRDTPKVLTQNWPVFSRGRFAQDAAVRASVVEFRVPLEIEGAVVNPGDLIVADLDGVVVVPEDVEDQVLESALEKATTESEVRKAIEAGMSSTEAFATFHVL